MSYQKVVINDATLYCGDMTEVIKDLQKVDLIASDNPYPLTSGGKNTGKMKGIFNPKVYNNNGHICRCDLQLDDWLPLCYDVLKPNSHAYFFANSKAVFNLYQSALDAGFDYHNILPWDKGNKLPNRWYMNCYEFVLMFKKGKAKAINNCGDSQKLDFPNPRNKDHPTQKPVRLFYELVANSSNPNDVVLDPFMGTGACGLASLELGRKFIGIEIEEEYFQKAVNKIKNFYSNVS